MPFPVLDPGLWEEARRAVELDPTLAQAARRYLPATELAFLHIGLGDHQAALDWLDKGVAEQQLLRTWRSPGP